MKRFDLGGNAYTAWSLVDELLRQGEEKALLELLVEIAIKIDVKEGVKKCVS